jgi:hypothetical protein
MVSLPGKWRQRAGAPTFTFEEEVTLVMRGCALACNALDKRDRQIASPKSWPRTLATRWLGRGEMGGINHLANQIGEHGARRDSASRGRQPKWPNCYSMVLFRLRSF